MIAPLSSLATILGLLLFHGGASAQENNLCTNDFVSQCQACELGSSSGYNCSLPGLQDFTPGQYEGVTVNYLNIFTDVSTPHFPSRALEFEACTGAKIAFSETSNMWEDAKNDLGSLTSRGNELYDGYFVSYSTFPSFSALGLLETLNERIREDNTRLLWEDMLPNVRQISQFRQDGKNNIDFLQYDADALLPIVRLDLLEQYDFSLPNTWEEFIEIAQFFHGMDLNEDGEPDFGLCHFPRIGSYDDTWWASELILATWASYGQTQGLNQGFVFDSETMEPQLHEGFRRAVEIWRTLFQVGEDAETDYFMEGRCAIGYGPPGTWKRVFLNQVRRLDSAGNMVWQPTMKSGEYAEPYRFKTVGTTEVWDDETKQLLPCTKERCPLAEVIPPHGHFDGSRVNILKPSPLEGKLVNRAPFYWAGQLGTMIRKNSDAIKKDVMWDFFVYTNSPATSTNDVANVASWLDSWRYSQLSDGENFERGGWSRQAFEEHKAHQRWAFASETNAAMNMRIPGMAEYSRDVLSVQMKRFSDNEITMDGLVDNVRDGWNQVTMEQGFIEQLQTYRAALQQDSLTEFELCSLHGDAMDAADPSICRKYDQEDSTNLFVATISLTVVALIAGLAGFLWMERRRREDYKRQVATGERDELQEVQQLTAMDNLRVAILRSLLIVILLPFSIFMGYWSYSLLVMGGEGSEFLQDSPESFAYTLFAFLGLALMTFVAYDCFVRIRNQKLLVNAAKSSEIVSSLFPARVRNKVLDQTKTNIRAGTDKHKTVEGDSSFLAELYPKTTVLFADIAGFTSWSSTRTPEQVFQLLEAVFGAFDTLAKECKVYKVETVGDCYVAITGLPLEQPEHCLIMCRYAKKVMKLFFNQVHQLATALGPDTADLQLRVGIHTGQVTAGVLRGDRARFSLFGDTVNTTARIQTTSDPNFIQLSKEAADELVKFGKESWIEPRELSVFAKGKGILDTFWLVATDDLDTSSYRDASISHREDAINHLSSALKKPQTNNKSNSRAKDRLIDWNVRLLLGLVKKIVAYRQTSQPTTETPAAGQDLFELKDGYTYLDEFQTIIELPQHQIDATGIVADVDLPAVVVNELRLLVSTIKDMYNKNPFHNFEHASHVTMSVIKLLSRIVQPPKQMTVDGPSLHDHSYGITSDPLTQFACAFSALVHDADHPGVPNGDLIQEDPLLSQRFQGRSVAEQNSLYLTLNLLSEDRFRNLHNTLFVSRAEQERFRALVVSCVLSTDIGDKELKQLRNARWETAFSKQLPSESNTTTVNRKATIVIEHLIQASDVAHTMQHWNIYRKWNERLFLEMYAAFKCGRSQMDPTKNWVKGEIGFFDFYIIPLAKKLKDCKVFGVSSDEYLNYALANRRKWEIEGEAIVSGMIQKLQERLEEEEEEHSEGSRTAILTEEDSSSPWQFGRKVSHLDPSRVPEQAPH